MSAEINFTKAAIVACYAIAIGPSLPTTVMGAASAFFWGRLGVFGINLISKYINGPDPAQKVLSKPKFDVWSESLSLQKALERIKANHGRSYKIFCDLKGLKSDEEVLHFFQKKMGGTCKGQVSNILDTARQTGESFGKQLIAKMKSEEVFYKQILETLRSTIVSREEGIDILAWGTLRQEDSLASLPKNESLHPEASIKRYQSVFKRMTESNARNFQGAVVLPEHVIAIQYSKEDGYYLYDSISERNGGLFKCDDENAFFQKLRAQVLLDLEDETDAERSNIEIRLEERAAP